MLIAGPSVAHAETVRKIASDTDVAAHDSTGKTFALSRRSTSGKAKTETLGSFTPPTLDGVRKTTGSGSVAAEERTFRFTPSGKVGDRNALSVGVTSRVVRTAVVDTARTVEADAITAYNVDVAVAYLGFAISGGFSRLDSALEPGREGIDLGLSYRGKRWKTAMQLSTDHAYGGRISPIGTDKRYSVELGGAYALNSRLSVLGGVRYQMIEPDAFGSSFLDQSGEQVTSGDARGVYLGTSLSF